MDKIKEKYKKFKEWLTKPRLTHTTYLKSFIRGWFIGGGIVAWSLIIVVWIFILISQLKAKFTK